jgi:hypothetical protein
MKNIRPAVKREAERIDVLPRLSFIERSLIAFVFVGLRVWKAKNLCHGAVFCSETLTTYKKLVTNQKEFFTNGVHQQRKFVCVARQCAEEQ